MKLLLRHQAILLVVAGLIFLTNLGSYALFNEDEPKNAACGAEMFRRGDVIVPTFNEDLRTDKPILVYWFMLTSYKLFGINEFSARLASAILAIGTTLLTYHLGRKLYSAEIGFIAAIILCTCLFYSAVGRSATPDSTLVFFVTLTFASYVWVIAHQHGGNFNISRTAITSQSPAAQSESSAARSPGRSDSVDAPEPATVEHSTPDQTSAQSVTLPPNPTPVEDNPQPTPEAITHPLLKQFVPANWKWAAPMFAAMGFAVLAKGPVGFILPTAIIALFLLILLRDDDLATEAIPAPTGRWWRKAFVMLAQFLRFRRIFEVARGMHLLIGLGIVAAVALPWYLTVGFKTHGDWLRGFLLNHNLDRALTAKEGHSGFPLYQLYYVVVIHICCFPWSVFLPASVYQWWQRQQEGAPWRASDQLVACWIGVWFIVFSLVTTKLPNYLLPLYPAVALLIARYLFDWQRDDTSWSAYSFTLCCRVLAGVGVVLVIGMYIMAFLYIANDQWVALIGLIPIAGAFVAMKFIDQEQRQRVVQTLMLTAVTFVFLMVGVVSSRLGPYQDTRLFVAEARAKAKTNDINLATYGFFDANAVFYAGKRVQKLDTPREVANFLAANSPAYIIARERDHNALREELTSDVIELSRHRNFLRRDERILLGRD